MDFLLIYPPSYTREPEFPIGGLFLAHSLIKNNFSLRIVNDSSYKKIISFAQNNIDTSTIAIGLSVVSVMAIKDALNLTKELKNLYSNIPIIWGGQHIMAQPEEALKYQYVDYVVVGEGEKTLPLLLKAIRERSDLSKIKGIGFKTKEKFILTNKQNYTSLNGVFDLPYNLLDIDSYYRKLNLGGEKWLSAMYSRGCPFKCSFCINSTIGGINSKIRYHDIDHIIHDIKILVNKYNADSITILDDHFFLIEDRVLNFCKQILKNNISINFRATGRVDSLCSLDDSTYKLLHKTGFLCIGAGIESGSKKMLKLLNKNISFEQVDEVDSKLGEYNIYKHWNFITALPGETIEDVHETIELITKLAKTSLDSPYPFSSYKKYIPLPKTTLYEWALKEYNFKPPQSIEEWAIYSRKFLNEKKCDLVLRPWMDEELANYTDKIQKIVFKLNQLFVGKEADSNEILERIKWIESNIL